MRTSFEELIENNEYVLADGAMGTMLFDMGLAQGEPPERWNLERPDLVRLVHREYAAAGAQIILTNSFGANRRRLKLHKLDDSVAELNFAAARLARGVADEAEHPVLVAGSIGPSGSFLEPLGDMQREEAVDIFHEQAHALMEGGVDVFWIETMYDLGEVEAAVEGCRLVDQDFPVVTTMTFDTGGKTMMGLEPGDAAAGLEALGVVALGGNCGNGPEEVETAVASMNHNDDEVLLAAKANAGVPHLEDGLPVYDADPAAMAEYALRARERGARIIGACCGSTPDHIRAMADALRNRSRPE